MDQNVLRKNRTYSRFLLFIMYTMAEVLNLLSTKESLQDSEYTRDKFTPSHQDRIPIKQYEDTEENIKYCAEECYI